MASRRVTTASGSRTVSTFSWVGLRRAGLTSSTKRVGLYCCFTWTCGGVPVVCSSTTDRSACAANVIPVITVPGTWAGPCPGRLANQGVAAGAFTSVSMGAGDDVSAVLPVIVACSGTPRLSAVGGGTADFRTLQPPQHRATVRMPMHTLERREAKFTCLSFLLVLAPQWDGKRLGDDLVLCVQVFLLDHQAIVLDRNDFATVFPHVRIECRKVTLPIRRLN